MNEYDAEETARLVQSWLDVFGRNRQGLNTEAYLWHVFSSGRIPCSSGEKARRNYAAEICCEFVILSNDLKKAVGTDIKPEKPPFSDCYVFPPNLAWTMAFTHEDGWLGPYFARHPRYSEINPVNIAKVRKREEMARAKAQGWR